MRTFTATLDLMKLTHRKSLKPKTEEKAIGMLINCAKDHFDQYEALLEPRNNRNTGLSPIEMLFGNGTRRLLPILSSNLD